MRTAYQSRRDFLRACALGAMASSCCTHEANRKKPRPNFLVVFTDDQTYRAIGYDNPKVKTPNLDRLAANGMIFENAYVASPICVASRASALTSLYPQQHEAVALNKTAFEENIASGKYKTLAHALSRAHYLTGFCGKSHLGNPQAYGFREGHQHRQDSEAFVWAKDFLDRAAQDDSPFLLWVAPTQPHLPLRPNQEWLDLYREEQLQVEPNFRQSPPPGSLFNQGLPGETFYRDSKYTNNHGNLPGGPPRSAEMMLEFIKAYYATISHLDHQVGNLIAHLKSAGLYENTVIVFASDNGYFLGNHGLGNKITMHEESVRVPMFVHWSQLPRKGIRCRQLVSTVDILPTLLDMAGTKRPETAMGKSLAPLFSDPASGVRKYVASECVGVGGSKGQGHRMVRTKQWKYVLTGTNEEALFDEEADPYEMNNLARDEQYRKVLSKMRRHMSEWMDAVGDGHDRPPDR